LAISLAITVLKEHISSVCL